MPTDKPNIVIAKPPRRIRAKPKAAVPARIVVDHNKLATVAAEEHAKRGEAADRLWQEMKRAVSAGRK